jgi:pimeloyl-ACP methyl ester carboxylesterase
MNQTGELLDSAIETVRGGRRLRVARLGTGPQLILLHGYPDNLQIWRDVARRLADRFEVIAFDWPGLGQSDAWPGGATPFHMADRLLELLDEWGIRRAGLVGMDMGAQPGLVFAALHPERANFLVAMNCLAFWDMSTSWEIAVLRKFGWNRFILSRLPSAVFRRAERTFLPAEHVLSKALRADLWESFRQKEVRDFIVRMCAGYQGTLPRLPELYRQIACPTLVLWGERDKHFPPVQAHRLHETIKGSKLRIIPDAEHWMALHLADVVAEEIRGFSTQSAVVNRPADSAALLSNDVRLARDETIK